MQSVLYVRDGVWFAAPHALNAPLVVEGLSGKEQCLFLGGILPSSPELTCNRQWYNKSSHTEVGGTLFTLKKTASSHSPTESKNYIRLNVKETRPISTSQTVSDTLLSKKQQSSIVSQMGMDHLEAIWTSRFYCTCKGYCTVTSLHSQCFFIGQG